MPSTEFLLYLVIVIFAVFFITNYYKDTTEPEIRYKYIPMYRSEYDDSQSVGSKSGSEQRQNISTASAVNRRISDYPQGQGYNGGQNYIQGRPGNINIDVNNRNLDNDPAFPPVPSIDPLRKFDYDTVNDDFTPPFRRGYYDDYNYRLPPPLFPAYTRGPPGRFRKVGMLIAQGVSPEDKYKFLLLMGREKYTNRDFEYFATSPDSEQRLKFYIETKGKEINDGDIVKIPELEGYTFTFKEDQDLSPKYDPYII